MASLSVDLDPLRCYYGIHGLGAPPHGLRDVVLVQALPRFLELFSRYHIKATFFVVGSDLDREPGKSLVTACARAGHELGNHSHTHPYDLARLPREQIELEVGSCHEALRQVYQSLGHNLARATEHGHRPANEHEHPSVNQHEHSSASPHEHGSASPHEHALASQHASAETLHYLAGPRGFRSPGYDLSPELLSVVEEMGYSYDSSIFPCPAYYAAKTAAMAAMALSGRRSQAVLGAPTALLAPAEPYRPDPLRPYRPGQAQLIELPVAVTPGLRLPAIGTSLFLSERLRIFVLESMRRRSFFNLELHGLDLIDAEEDGIPTELVARQPDLRVPLLAKLRALTATLDRLRGEYEILPLHEVAEEVQRSGSISRSLAA